MTPCSSISIRRGLLGFAIASVLFGAPGFAAAAPVNDAAVVPIQSESENIGGWTITGDIDIASLDLTVAANASWTAAINTNVSFESDDVRQGASLDVARSATASIGLLSVHWTLSGTINAPIVGTVPIGPLPLTADNVLCVPALAGGAYDCVANSGSVELVGLPPGLCIPPFVPGIPGHPYVELSLRVTFTITPDGIVTQRKLIVDDDDLVDDSLSLTPDVQSEELDMPCTAPAGSEVAYALTDYSWAPSTTASQRPVITVGIMDPLIGCGKIAAFSDEFGPANITTPDFVLVGDGHTTDMGELLENDVPPTIAPMSTFNGVEGSPVMFGASVTSQCPIGTQIWHFSDGGTAFGAAPAHTFEDDGLYSGQLTVIDITGLDAVRDFSANISNAAPTAYAGPDTSGVWGAAIAFNGQGVDPGAVDNATLVYSWNWGDGTPGSGGAHVAHVYANPGSYQATLTVCDDHGCVSDAAGVLVRRRGTVVSYTGANAGVYSSTAQVAGSVIDELGTAVPGASVSFTLGGSGVGSAQTDGAGNASRTITVGPSAGTYAVGAAYAGSALYEGNSASESFDVARMATAVAYTGALSGAPNKVASLSAQLADALGRPLAGKLVVFQLGAQTAQATTNASGVAATTLKLSQKNGSYTLTTSYTPAAADADKWLGASATNTFRLQAK